MRRPLAWVVLALVAASATADVVHLKGGGRLSGEAEEDGDSVRVTMPGGTMTLAKSRVERIERQETPAQEFARRRRELATGDAAGARGLAAWAAVAGLVREHGDALALAASWAPGDAGLADEFERWRVFDRELPGNAAGESALAASTGDGTRIYLTPHWRIAYRTDLPVARRRGELLENAWRKFRVFAAQAGVGCTPIEDRLECMVHVDYDDWLRATGLPEEKVAGLTGLYVGNTRRILLYDTRTSPSAQRAAATVDEQKAAIEASRKAVAEQRVQISEAEGLLADAVAKRSNTESRIRDWLAQTRPVVEANERDIAAGASAIERFRDESARHFDAENVSTTTHEACHQIAFALGVSRAGQPLWLLEGLATLFEAESRTSFVLAASNSGRLSDVRAAWGRGDGGSLASVVTDAVFVDSSRRHEAYAESWALTYFLAQRHGAEFASFLSRCSTQTDEASRLADFRRFFGADLGALEREWRGYVSRL